MSTCEHSLQEMKFPSALKTEASCPSSIPAQRLKNSIQEVQSRIRRCRSGEEQEPSRTWSFLTWPWLHPLNKSKMRIPRFEMYIVRHLPLPATLKVDFISRLCKEEIEGALSQLKIGENRSSHELCDLAGSWLTHMNEKKRQARVKYKWSMRHIKKL